MLRSTGYNTRPCTRQIKVGMMDPDVTRLEACHTMLRENLGRPVTSSMIYSVGLKLLHQRLLEDSGRAGGVHLLFRV
jgi:hypothetical protein